MSTILVVDDESEVRHLAKTMLERVGYRVLVADSATTALKILNDPSESIDLVLTDYSMPGMDGIQLSVRIQELYPKMFVIILSGFGQVLSTSASVEVIDKPLDFDLLLNKIQRLLGEA